MSIEWSSGLACCALFFSSGPPVQLLGKMSFVLLRKFKFGAFQDPKKKESINSSITVVFRTRLANSTRRQEKRKYEEDREHLLCEVDEEKVAVETCLYCSCDPHDPVDVVLGEVAVDPIHEIKTTVGAESKQIMSCNGLGLPCLGQHE